MLNKLLITKSTSVEEIRQAIGKLREQKGKEKETLKLINEALNFGHDFVVHLFLEEALTHQHAKSYSDMEKAILKAKFYINKFKLIGSNPELFKFLGKVADYKGQHKKAISYYKKSGEGLKSNGNISYSLIMSGEYEKGYKLAKDTYNNFLNSFEGKELRKKDYEAWAIWMSGVTIRTVNALIDKRVNFNQKEIEKWVEDTEKYLNQKNKFSYRKEELKQLKLKLN